MRDTVVVIAGAASGIGRAVALRFAAAGAQCGLLDANAAGLDETAALVHAAGARARVATADVRSEEEVARALDEVAPDRVDILVHCAGVTAARLFLDLTLEEWRRILDVNLTGSFIVAQACARRMVGRGGAIVLTSSVTGAFATTSRTAYAASKGGVEMLARAMALELANHGVRVNVVAPGAIETPLTASFHAGPSAAIGTAYTDRAALGRYGQAHEIAEAAFWLASPAASYVTGQVLRVDGGFSAVGMRLDPAPFRS